MVDGVATTRIVNALVFGCLVGIGAETVEAATRLSYFDPAGRLMCQTFASPAAAAGSPFQQISARSGAFHRVNKGTRD
jgi:hypothetical protein